MRNLARRSSLFAQAGDHTQPLLFQGSLGLCVGVLARRHLHLGGTPFCLAAQNYILSE